MATMMNPVKSSMFSHIGYDAETLTLLVRFHPSKKQIAAGEPGDLWEYSPVVSEKWDEAQAAESVGKWFLASIKGKYEGKKVEPITFTGDPIIPPERLAGMSPMAPGVWYGDKDGVEVRIIPDGEPLGGEK